MKWYGNVANRIEEGHNFNKDGLIHEGDDITMYQWSDRTCYYVTKVIDQKHIFVHKYHVCADREKEGGQGHQNWKYFKTAKEEAEYLNKCFVKEGIDTRIAGAQEEGEEEWKLRYNHWCDVQKYDKHTCEKLNARWGLNKDNAKDFYINNLHFTDKQYEDHLKGKTIYKYNQLSNSISFGVRDYYYDWEF